MNAMTYKRTIMTVALMVAGTVLWAQTFLTSWGDSQSDGVRESASTSVYSPGRHAFDASLNTAWQLANGSTSGWIERYWPAAQRLGGVSINLDLPQGVQLQLSSLQQNHWVAIPGAVVVGPVSGTTTLTFPGEMPPTTRVLIGLSGAGVDQAKVWNLGWKQSLFPTPFKKILPQSYTLNQNEYINLKPSRLWDGVLGNQWFEPLWSTPWEVFQTDVANKPTAIFPPYLGNPAKDAEIVWQLDGTYQVKTLKVSFLQGNQLVQFEFWDGSKWINTKTLGTNIWNPGWQRLDLSTAVSTNKVRITFPGGWDRGKYVGELEVWGTGWPDQGLTQALPIGSPSTVDGSWQFTVSGQPTKDLRLDVAVNGKTAAGISGNWNGTVFTAVPKTWIGSQTIYSIKLSKESQRSDNQFLKLVAPGTPTSVTLTPDRDNGQVSLGFPYSDGQFETTTAGPSSPVPAVKSQQWDLGGTYQLEKLRVYAPVSTLPNFQTVLGKTQTSVTWNAKENGWWEASLAGIPADHLQFSSSTAVLIDEVQLYGTPLNDTRVGMEIWYPPRNATVTASSGSDTNSIIGWMGNSSVSPLVGSFHPRQADKLFWMPMNQMPGAFDQGKAIDYSGVMGTASVGGTYPVTWLAQNDSSTLTQGAEYVSTQNATITLSGTISKPTYRVFINGTEVPVVSGKYSTSVTLQEGLQLILVQVWDKNHKKIQAQWTKAVYRTVGNPVLQFDLPAGELWTQQTSLLVTGRVGNGTGLALTINGIAVPLNGSTFSQNLSLTGALSTWNFTLKDDTGRVTNQTLTVNQGSSVPVVSIKSPTNGQYLANSTVTFQIQGPQIPLWWKFNQEAWEPATGFLETKSYTLADGFYTYSMAAQDRMGNISQTVQVPFCVDTVAPHPFVIAADISGWSSNNTPTISFGTTDDTSGMDRYEVQVDNGISTVQTSPYLLPTLADGVRNVFVRAYDKSGNVTIATIALEIDTSPPNPPTQLNPVPGATEIDVSWNYGIDDGEGFRTFRVERSPPWSEGVRKIDGLFTVDSGLTAGNVHKYRIWSVDRSGNTSLVSDWKSAQVGFAEVPVSATGPTAVEYKTAAVTVTPQTLPADVTKVTINEIPVEALQTGLPVNPVVSQIIQFRVVRTDASGITTTTEHADLAAPVPVQLTYDPTKVPQGYTESQLKPFYYDTVWGRWIPINGAFVDTTTHTVNFRSNHFSDYSVQATQAVDETPQQMRDVQFSPFGTQTTHGPLSVSPQGGSVSTEFTELVLPGKNGLDLVLKRAYDTGTAQADLSAMSPSSNGEFPWKLGTGWRLLFPSLKWNGEGLWVKDLDGRTYSFGQMNLANTYSSGGNQVVVLTNHESLDGTVEATLKAGPLSSYSFQSATLTMKDGRKVDYDAQGRVSDIWDSVRINRIHFDYINNQANKITDTMGREVTFGYTADRITSISVKGGNESYPYPITYLSPNGTLDSATDVGKRVWTYQYTPTSLKTWSHLLNPPANYAGDAEATTTTIQALGSMSGVGIGTSTVIYQTQTFTYSDSVPQPKTFFFSSSSGNYNFQVNYQQIQAKSLTVGLDSQKTQRTTQYQFSTVNAEGSQFYTSQSIINDGRLVVTTEYTPVSRPRKSLSDAPDALKNGFSFGSRPATSEILTYPSKTTTTTAKVDMVQAIPAGTELEKQTQVWDTATMRVMKNTVVRSASVTKSAEYAYDTWGNVTKLTESSTVGGWQTKKVTIASYYNSGEPSVDLGLSAWPHSLLDRTFTGGQRNLTAAIQVQSSGAVPGSSTLQTTTETQCFDYTPLGQLETKYQKAPLGTWAVTGYLYDPVTGQVSQVTSPGPLNQVTTYDYDYATSPSTYFITTTKKSVDLGDGTPINVVAKAGYRTLNGTLVWTQNANGYSTLRVYDELGRVKSIIEPTDLDTTFAPMPAQPFVSGDKNPVTSVDYNDDLMAPTSAVTNPLRGKTTYSFDSLGRLTEVAKINQLEEKTSLLGTTLETITTKLGYDGYDQVTSLLGPWADTETDKTRNLDTLVTSITYDARGRVLTVHAPGTNGTKTSRYNDQLNQVTTIDELGNKSIDTIDWNGKVVNHKVSVDQSKQQWIETQSYVDADGRVLAQYDGNQNLTKLSYNEFGQVSEIVSPNRQVFENGVTTNVSPVTTRLYYLDGSLQSVVQPLPSGTRETNYFYNGLGKVIKTTSPVTGDGLQARVIVATNTYDHNGNLLTQESGYQVDATHLNEATHLKSWTYDSHSRVKDQVDELKHTVSFTYDKAGNRKTVTDPRQGLYAGDFSLTLDYDQFNRLIHATLPRAADQANSPELYLVYDGRGNLVRRQEADGQTTLFEYTLRNFVSTQVSTDQSASETSIKYTTKFAYDDAGRQTTITTPSGRVVTNKYDEMGRVLSQGSDSLGWTILTYDDNGNKKSITDGRGNKTNYTYGPDNNVLTQTDAKLNVSSVSYDRWGETTQTIDGEKNTKTYSYDSLGRLIKESTPWGASIVRRYDAWGNQDSTTDARGTVFTRKFYDDNRLKEESAKNANLAELWSYVYDEGGDIKSATTDDVVSHYNMGTSGYQPNPFGLTTSVSVASADTTLEMGYSYDNRQRLRTVSYPDQTSASYGYNQLGQLNTMPNWITDNLLYDSADRLQKYTLSNKSSKTISYDENDRIQKLEYKGSDQTTSLKSYQFTYDKASNILTKNGNAYAYDELNRLYTSNEQGWFLKTPDDLAQQTGYGVGLSDHDYQMNTPVLSFEVTPSTVVKLDYASRSVTVNLGVQMGVNKIVLKPTSSNHRVKKEDLTVLASANNKDYSVIADWEFTKNQDGSLILQFPKIFLAQYVKVTAIWDDRDGANSPVDKATFVNQASQLVQVWALSPSQVQEYHYDRNGNRVSLVADGVLQTSQYYKNLLGGNLAWLAKDSNWSYQYDLNGNLVTKAKNATVDVTKPTDPSAFVPDTTQEVWRYSWDLHNRLTSVSRNGVQVASYLYDANNLRVSRTGSEGTTVYAYGRNGAIAYQKTTNNGETAGKARTYAYLGDQTIGWIDTAANGTQTKYYAVTDQLGSVTAVTDNTGTVKWSSEYDPFGKTAGIEGLYDFDGSYAGHQPDNDVGLIYMWNRWQDPETGRFISEDPARDGENWYSYASSNPINRWDPTGLTDKKTGDYYETTKIITGGTTGGKVGDGYETGKNAAEAAIASAAAAAALAATLNSSTTTTTTSTSTSSGSGGTKSDPTPTKPEPVHVAGPVIQRQSSSGVVGGPNIDSDSTWQAYSGAALRNAIIEDALMSGWKVGGRGDRTRIIPPDNRNTLERLLAPDPMYSLGLLVSPSGRLSSPQVAAGSGILEWVGPGGAGKAIGATGKLGEAALKALGGQPQIGVLTTDGWRFIDQLINGVAHESKVGYTSLTRSVGRQIRKDMEIMRAGDDANMVVWHFFQSPVTGKTGPSGPLLMALLDAGFEVVIH